MDQPHRLAVELLLVDIDHIVVGAETVVGYKNLDDRDLDLPEGRFSGESQFLKLS